VRRHFRLAPDRSVPDRVEVFVGVGHELYLTPLPGGEILVAALCERAAIVEPTGGTGSGPAAGVEGPDGRTSLPALIALHPALADRLRGATPVSAPRGRFPLACRARAGIAPGAVLLGDAAGFSDPITGGGMAQALLSAELLATFLPRALADSADEWLWRFDRRRRALLRDYLWLTRLTLELSRSARAARTMLRLMRGHPRVMRHLVGVAAGLRRLTL
jgi:2-polyprenyl-6-methoxyphenol hydroxylase-like FAD-dependent oxidoreductase